MKYIFICQQTRGLAPPPFGAEWRGQPPPSPAPGACFSI